MNRDSLVALARGAITVLAGAALIVALARWLGWWCVGALAIAALLDMARWPRAWRPW